MRLALLLGCVVAILVIAARGVVNSHVSWKPSYSQRLAQNPLMVVGPIVTLPSTDPTEHRGSTFDLLRSVLIFGDSLTAGAYYSAHGGHLKFETHNWAKVVENILNMKIEAWGKAHRINGNHPLPAAKVTRIGFPGKDSKALSKKLRKVLQRRWNAAQRTSSDKRHLPEYSLVLIMSGTNDVVGLGNDLAMAMGYVKEMHRDVRTMNCGRAAAADHQLVEDRRAQCGSVALLIPPLNFSVPSYWYHDELPRAYCSGKALVPAVTHALHSRQRQLNREIEAAFPSCCVDMVNASIAYAASPPILHGLGGVQEVQQFWSDCLHPNAQGYDRFGRVVLRSSCGD